LCENINTVNKSTEFLLEATRDKITVNWLLINPLNMWQISRIWEEQ
jgi:hypothetical protein